MGFSPSEMEFQKTKEAASRDIALAFGVPPMLLGLPRETRPLQTTAEAHRAFYRLTVLARWAPEGAGADGAIGWAGLFVIC